MKSKQTPTEEPAVRKAARPGSIMVRDTGYRPKLVRVDNNSLYMKVYDELHQALMSGVFRPGEPVTLRQLIMRLGTSAMPVRQAVGRLIAEGALKLLPNRSVIVPPMSRKRFTELWKLRQLLEGMAAESACHLAAAKVAKRLKQINASIKRSQAEGDLTSVLLNNQKFHFAIYDMADMAILQSLISILWLQAGPFLYLTLMSRRQLWNLQRHAEAIKAFEAGDPVAARKAIERDVATAFESLLEHGIFSPDEARDRPRR
jgi:DNA-binding GntR family transcriptional regulator